jgi:hypothetical protein
MQNLENKGLKQQYGSEPKAATIFAFYLKLVKRKVLPKQNGPLRDSLAGRR